MNNTFYDNLIPPIITLIGILLTQFLPKIFTKNKRKVQIYEQQYRLFFIPIKKVLLFSDKKDWFSEIKEIINFNFELMPNQLLKTFNDCLINNTINDDFIEQINLGYIILNNSLNYSNNSLDSKKIKFSNEVEKISNKAIKQTSHTFIAAIIIVTISFILSIINIFINNIISDSIIAVITISAFIVEIIPFIIWIFKLIYKYFKYYPK